MKGVYNERQLMKYKDDSLVASFYDSQTTTFQEQGFETELAFELQVFVASLDLVQAV